MPYLHIHDGEQVIYNDVCPVCLVPPQIPELEEVNENGD
jgi:hypothetical protein